MAYQIRVAVVCEGDMVTPTRTRYWLLPNLYETRALAAKIAGHYHEYADGADVIAVGQTEPEYAPAPVIAWDDELPF